MQKRIASESRRDPFHTTAGWKPKQKKQHMKWVPVDGSKERGETLAARAILHPASVVRLYVGDAAFEPLLKPSMSYQERQLAHQLEAMANRAQHILVPRELRETHKFIVIVDRDGVFDRVEAVPKGEEPKILGNGSRIVERRSELDIATPYSYKNPEVGMKRMGISLRKIFFKDRGIKVCEWGCQQLFFAPSNFNLAGIPSHISLEWTQADHIRLQAKYYREHRKSRAE